MHIRLVRYFVALAREVHFEQAAAFSVTQPTLSARSSRLRSNWQKAGIRECRYIELTPEGAAMLQSALILRSQ